MPSANAYLDWIAPGPDGALWFTENTANKIGRITTAGAITEYPMPSANAGAYAIVTGPDLALWFTEQTGHGIARITTAGTITEFPVDGGQPEGIASGPDRSLWFMLSNTNALASAPACALGLSASFSGNMLTTSFDIGIAQPAVGASWPVAPFS